MPYDDLIYQMWLRFQWTKRYEVSFLKMTEIMKSFSFVIIAINIVLDIDFHNADIKKSARE